jgi:hypothetical protein
MSALEQELFDKIRKLDEAHQKQLLQIVDNMQPKPFDFDEWMRQVEEFQAKLRAEYGEDHVFGTLDLLHEMRQ